MTTPGRRAVRGTAAPRAPSAVCAVLALAALAGCARLAPEQASQPSSARLRQEARDAQRGAEAAPSPAEPRAAANITLESALRLAAQAPAAAAAAGRWAEGYACVMHPDQLQPEGGVCRICNCGMQTVKWRVEKLLSVPETAVIDTGARQMVYVETQPGVYDARTVTLGQRAGAYYPVLSGLALDERVVTRGSFLIDAEARLNPAAAATFTGAAAQTQKQAGHGQH